ncbi:Uncharacterized protein TCM_036609 [Theobroma cacao]|uniref:DUF7745 domain-containing protein n=1 Tax=Theobroma cacao TaxID=3641 RepID=A0A061FK29_THECC|nr:Uncharacterized protein TCM_036609 [Theobroma cacao]
MEDEQGLLAFAMAIYGLVVFSKVLGHVEVSVIDFFDQVTRSINPAPSILAETLRSLNFCRCKREGRFIGCAQLLTIWIKSHFKCKESKFRKPYLSSLMGPWGAINYAPIMVRKQFGSEQFMPMTHQLNQLEFTYEELETLNKIEKIAQDWKKTCQVDQGRVTDEVTTRYDTWHDQRVKNVVCPPRNPSKHPINPEPQNVLLESELTRKRLENEMMNMKRRHEDELEEVKKETTRKHEVRRQEQTIQELRNDCGLMETAMEGYKAQYELVRQEYFQMRERNDSCTQSLQRKGAEMRWILRHMREVAFRARVMVDKIEELK